MEFAPITIKPTTATIVNSNSTVRGRPSSPASESKTPHPTATTNTLGKPGASRATGTGSRSGLGPKALDDIADLLESVYQQYDTNKAEKHPIPDHENLWAYATFGTTGDELHEGIDTKKDEISDS
jgi:hypothetical protein